jgi:hypothetical protein
LQYRLFQTCLPERDIPIISDPKQVQKWKYKNSASPLQRDK